VYKANSVLEFNAKTRDHLKSNWLVSYLKKKRYMTKYQGWILSDHTPGGQ